VIHSKTFAPYYRLYVYDHDFSKAKDVTYNSDTLSSGNLVTIFASLTRRRLLLEYHFPGLKRNTVEWIGRVSG